MGFKRFVFKNNLGFIKKNFYFKSLTTMKVGGRIKYLYYPSNIDNLRIVIDYLNKKNIEYLFIGNGSNIIASSKFYRGVVISSKYLPHTMNIDNNVISVTGFYDLRRLVSFTSQRSISTFTNLAGIPASVGGALYMNAGAHNSSISDNLISVTFLKDNKIVTRYKEQLDFGYRHSDFMSNKAIILEASFDVVYDKDSFISYKRILDERRCKHPVIFPNSGSIFRNLPNKKAYEIIKELDLDGCSIGRAQVSMKHCNFIINTGDARAEDILKIILKIKNKAKKHKYLLKEEVILFNFKKYNKNT